jgi:XapX domain-containing protein
MKIYIVSLLAGVLAGAVYGLIGVRSPAPPVVALVGLLGMLLGEQGLTLGKRVLQRQPLTSSWFAQECVPKITGAPPVKSMNPEGEKP